MLKFWVDKDNTAQKFHRLKLCRNQYTKYSTPQQLVYAEFSANKMLVSVFVVNITIKQANRP